MVYRVCPVCGSIWYSADNTQTWVCDKCNTVLPPELNKDNKQRGDINMTTTGIIRRMDDMGRVVIPREFRQMLNIQERDPLELVAATDGIYLKKYHEENNYINEIQRIKCWIEEDINIQSSIGISNKLQEIIDILNQKKVRV